MNILSWILFGAASGILANVVDPSPSRGGLLGAMVLGILGAILGGFISNIVFGVGITGFNVQSLIVATLGALLLLFLQRAFVNGTE